MKIHNVSDKFKKVHTVAFAKGIAQTTASVDPKLFTIRTKERYSFPIGGTVIDEASRQRIRFELVLNSNGYSLSPLGEDDLLAIERWEERYKDYEASDF